MLHLRGIGRTFVGPPEAQALRAIDLRIDDGEFVAIEGPSGGGKSTLLNVIGLLDQPDAGRYLVGNVDTSTASDNDLAALRSDRFSFVFQSFHLLDRRAVLDSVGLGLLYRGVGRAEREARSRAALAALGIEHLAEGKAHLLSGGERQRVAIARALATGSPVLVADEPTGNLDSANSERVVDALRRVHAEGTTIVLVTHAAEVAAAASRRVRIRDGALTADQPSTSAPTPAPAPIAPGRASVLRLPDLLIDAIVGLASRRSRTVGLIVAVALAVALGVGSTGLAASARAQVSSTFDAHSNREVLAQWTPSPDESQMPEISKMLAALVGVTASSVVDDQGAHAVAAMTGRSGLAVGLFSAHPDVVVAARLTLDEGWDRPEAGVLLGKNLADQLDARIVPGAVVLLDGRAVPVAGVITASPRVPELMGAVVALDEARTEGTVVRHIALLVTSSGAAQQVARQVPFAIDPTAPGSIELFAPTDPGTLRAEIETDVLTALLGFSGIAALAATLALANSMVMAVLERQAELALRRAVGARRRHIRGLILVESILLGATGGIAGLVAGLVALAAITIANRWAPVFEPTSAPLAVVGGIVVGTIGGVTAAIRAGRIRPGEALRL